MPPTAIHLPPTVTRLSHYPVGSDRLRQPTMQTLVEMAMLNAEQTETGRQAHRWARATGGGGRRFSVSNLAVAGLLAV
jgi:hypothetical protein